MQESCLVQVIQRSRRSSGSGHHGGSGRVWGTIGVGRRLWETTIGGGEELWRIGGGGEELRGEERLDDRLGVTTREWFGVLKHLFDVHFNGQHHELDGVLSNTFRDQGRYKEGVGGRGEEKKDTRQTRFDSDFL